MRILIAHSRYMTGPVSGENRVVDDEARLLAEGGHEVDLWEPLPDESQMGTLDLASAGVRSVWSRPAARAVRERIRSHRPDVVHLHNMYPMLSPSVIRAARSEGVPVVMTLNNYRLLCLPAIFLRDGATCELCLGHVPWQGVRHGCYRGSKAASAAIATSLTLHRGIGTFEQVGLYLAATGFVRDKHVEAGMDGTRIRVKPNFAWPAPRRDGPGSGYLFLGRLAEEKGAGLLVDMWEPSFGKLFIRGDGPQEAELRARAPEGVEFLPRVSDEEMQRLIASVRAVLVPSLSFEGLPRSIAEAYAAGVPVVATRIGAIPEVVEHDVTGLLVDDAGGFRDALTRLQDDAVSERLGAEALARWGAAFDPISALASLESAYQEVSR